MTIIANELEPKLAPPGAGLPKIELLIARTLFGWRRLRGNQDSFSAKFKRERDSIQSIIAGCSPEQASRRTLIERPRGLEDSSRFWSVWMTLDHLRIVNSAIARAIFLLAAGKTVPGNANTAAVKPNSDVTNAIVGDYEKSCDAVIEAATGRNLKTRGTHAHPWFGPLNALDWHALAGTHMALHRGQIEKILKAQAQPVCATT